MDEIKSKYIRCRLIKKKCSTKMQTTNNTNMLNLERQLKSVNIKQQKYIETKTC